MKKLAIISDLHADINEFDEETLALIAKYIRDSGANRLHIAGDLSNQFNEQTDTTILPIFNQYLPTTFNLGNHDMLELNNDEIENNQNPNFINFKPIILNKSTVFIALNGWYNYQFSENRNQLTDFNKVKLYKEMYWIDRFIHRGINDITLDNLICSELDSILLSLSKHYSRIIIATHFVPIKEFVTYKSDYNNDGQTWNILNGMLGSKHLGEIINKYSNCVSDVIFGHTHFRYGQKRINNINWHCRPIGYRFEWDYEKEWLKLHNLPEDRNLSIHKKTSRQFNLDVKSNLDKVLNNAVTYIKY